MDWIFFFLNAFVWSNSLVCLIVSKGSKPKEIKLIFLHFISQELYSLPYEIESSLKING